MKKIQSNIFAIALVLPLLSSCIYDELPECVRVLDYVLTVKVVDMTDGSDITGSGSVTGVSLYFFDGQGNFIGSESMDKNQVAGRKPVSFRLGGEGTVRVYAWGNLSDNVAVSGMNAGDPSSASFLTLKLNDEGYNMCPQDLFFGSRSINAVYTRSDRSDYEVAEEVRDEIIVRQKNGTMYVAVKGLDPGENPDDYYINVCHKYDRYTISGGPMDSGVDCEFMQGGAFEESALFRHAAPFYVVHCPEGMTPDRCTTVNLYKRAGLGRAGAGDLLIASTNDDENNIMISPQAGKATNVLLDISGGDGVEVKVEITDWDVVYQWEVL